MRKRILIVGGVAGGASAAARARRLDESAEIIMFEKGPHVSFSNCSLPFYLSKMVAKSQSLVLMSPETFKKRYDIDAVVHHEVVKVNPTEKTIVVKDLVTGQEKIESYDTLVLSPGANPIKPRSIAGIDSEHVFTVRNVVDIEAIDRYLVENDIDDIAVVGGGFIGIEVAENLRLAGKNVTMIEASDQVMAPFDYDFAQILHKELIDQGIQLIVKDGVSEITPEEVVLASGKRVKAGAVVMAIGVVAETALAKDAGLVIGETGAILVDDCYKTSDPDIYAVGDAIEVTHKLTGQKTRLTLAGPAQKQARAAMDDLYGIENRPLEVIGSSVVQLFELNAACTGLAEKTCDKMGIPYDSVYVMPSDKVSLMPDAAPMHFKLIFEVPSGKILGAQAIGKGNVDKRIDVIATVIAMGGTLEDVKDLELCYSPMYGTAKDVVNHAALVGLNILGGVYKQEKHTKIRELVENKAVIIDVREVGEFEKGHLKGAINIPLSEFRERMDEIPKDVPVYLHCRTSQRSYNATMALIHKGYTNVYNINGSYLGFCYYEYYTDVVEKRLPIFTEYNFN